jgi:hypothetical protein
MSRQRASAAREAFGRAMTVPAARTAARIEPAPRTEAPAGDRSSTSKSKYTLRLDPGPAADFDALAVQLRRQLGRRVEKSHIVRALIAMAADDATLREQLAGEICRMTA